MKVGSGKKEVMDVSYNKERETESKRASNKEKVNVMGRGKGLNTH